MFIFPLAIILFHDFYRRLLPSDALTLIPLSAFTKQSEMLTGIWNRSGKQSIRRVGPASTLPWMQNRGSPEEIPLRSHLTYKMDIEIRAYCAALEGDFGSHIDMLNFKVFGGPSGDTLIYARETPIYCVAVNDKPQMSEQPANQRSVMSKQWLNELLFEDVADISTSTLYLRYELKLNSAGKALYIEPSSHFRLRVNYDQGLRNLMLKRKFFAYIFGIASFFIIISTTTTVVALSSFLVIHQKFGKSRKVIKIN